MRFFFSIFIRIFCVMPFVKTDTFDFNLPILFFLTSFSCLIELAKTSSTRSNIGSVSIYPSLVPNFKENTFIIIYDTNCSFYQIPFSNWWTAFSLYIVFIAEIIFYHKCLLDFVKGFFCIWRYDHNFLLYSINVLNYID